jgi:hypothetical protein
MVGIQVSNYKILLVIVGWDSFQFQNVTKLSINLLSMVSGYTILNFPRLEINKVI